MHVVAMIDKLDLRVPAMTPLRPPFAELVYARAHGKRITGARSSTYYDHVFDLRRHGVDVILHYGAKLDRYRANKLELLGVGDKQFNALEERIAAIFEIDPGDLGVMRIDLAADIDGLSVRWCRRHARVRSKQHSMQISKRMVEVWEVANSKIETLYLGRSPNCIRFYDKKAQLRQRYVKEYSRLLRLHIGGGLRISQLLGFGGLTLSLHTGTGGPTITIPSFEQEYGISPNTVRTRIERQIGGGRVPPELDKVGKLRGGLPDFNPFAELRFLDAPLSADLCSLNARDYLMARGLQSVVDEYGYQRARQELNARSARNAARFFDRYGEFLAADPSDGPGITVSELLELYKKSIKRQLGATLGNVPAGQESLL